MSCSSRARDVECWRCLKWWAWGATALDTPVAPPSSGHPSRASSDPNSISSPGSGHKADNNVVLPWRLWNLLFGVWIVCNLFAGYCSATVFFSKLLVAPAAWTSPHDRCRTRSVRHAACGMGHGVLGLLFVVSRDNRRQLKRLRIFGCSVVRPFLSSGFGAPNLSDPIGIRSFVFILRFKM